MSKLPENLKRLRQQKGVYLKEIAPVLGMTVGTVSNYEHGVHAPNPDILILLADYYNVSVDYLVGHTDCSCPISDINRTVYGKYTVGQFLELLDQLPERELPHLVHMLKLFELQASYNKCTRS